VALSQAFDADALQALRKTVLAEAKAAGMTADRANDVMFAVHELAANVVRHGAGAGRLLMHAHAGQLYCHVSDAGADACKHARMRGLCVAPWPYQTGHGLWVVRQVADQMSVLTGPYGTQATAVFSLPGENASLPD
jgi:anti-sigma regulatory factor (Ser/Thr protein kinase)